MTILRRPPLAIMEVFEKKNPFALDQVQFRIPLGKIAQFRSGVLGLYALFLTYFFILSGPGAPGHFHTVFKGFEPIFWPVAAIFMLSYLADILIQLGSRTGVRGSSDRLAVRRDQVLTHDGLASQILRILPGRTSQPDLIRSLCWEEIREARLRLGGQVEVFGPHLDPADRQPKSLAIPAGIARTPAFRESIRKRVLPESPLGRLFS